jgi:tetratricopeptide (TPR) repeat protein
MKTLDEEAISAGIKGDWKEAIKINKTILAKKNKDIDALNRLSFAYFQIGELKLAKKTIDQALHFDRFDSIANKNLNLVVSFSKNKTILKQNPVENIDFIEEPGTKKIISLVELCSGEDLDKIRSGTKLNLKVRRRRICVQFEDKYLGKFPDDITRKLIKLIEQGEDCEVFFKSYDQKKLLIFLKLISKLFTGYDN